MHLLFEDYLESQGDETGDDAVNLSVGELKTIFRDSVIIPPRPNDLSEAEEGF